MRIPDLTRLFTAAINVDDLLTDLTAVAAVDRTQGSAGLDRLADDIAANAERAGLSVQLRRYPPAAPESRWWNFTAPAAKSPVLGAIQIAGEPRPVTSYPAVPCSLARGSAHTPPDGITAPLIDLNHADRGPLAGALVICPPMPRFAVGTLIAQLTAAGAAGFALESARRQGCDDTLVERLEVPDTCALVAFSISPAQADRLRAAASTATNAIVYARHQPPAAMPLVYARTPTGPDQRSALLLAHLCHPGPGADDNASGVAALLGIARASQRLYAEHAGPDLRFLWAPEMVGTAAYLHDIADQPHERPDFALSVDMIGGDPHQCGGVLNIEQSPDHLPSPLAGALEAAARAVTPLAVSYSGAVTVPTSPRAVVPFVGASDHLLFADRRIGIPAGHITRWPNRLHHSSHDTTATTSPQELHRNAVTIAAASTALCLGGAALTDIATAMYDLAVQRLVTAVSDDLAGTGPLTEAASPRAAQRDRLRRTHAAADAAFHVLQDWHPTAPPDVSTRRTALVRLADRLGRTCGGPDTPRDQRQAEPPLVRQWVGPWNLHTFDHALSPDGRQRLSQLLHDGRPAYARLVALALAIDDQCGRTEAVHRAEAAARLPIPPTFADAFLTLMADAGWITTQ